MTMTTDEFSPLTLAEITAATAKVKEEKVDTVWAARIATLNIGGGFLIKRTEAETQRAIKTRINRAAESSNRKLTWYPQTGNLADGKPGSYVVKVTAITVTPNAQNGTVQSQQTTEPQNTDNQPSEEEASTGPRRSRS